MAQAVVKISRYTYSDTIVHLEAAIAKGGGTLFAKIDQSAAAQSVGLALRPTTLLVFGNPKGGTPLMVAFPLSALELPLKLVTWDENGVVSVAYTPPQALVERYDLKGVDAIVAAIGHQLEALVAVVS